MNETKAIHQTALIVDAHADTPQRLLDDCWDFTSPDLGPGMISLSTARRGNLAAEFFAVWVEPTEHAGNFLPRALALIDAVHQQIRRHPEALALALTPADIRAAHAAGKFAIVLSLEGGHPIGSDLALLRTFYRLGVRSVTLTWANSNDWAQSSGPLTPGPRGLTPFGREVIHEMNSLGVIVDVSHVSDQTLADVLATSSAPVIASHSAARALTDVPRNLTDDQIRAIAATGGLVMVNFYPGFVHRPWRDAWERFRPAREAAQAEAAAPYRAAHQPVPFSVANTVDRHFAAQIPRPPLSALIDHFDHIIRVAGIDHVGLGSDFDGIPTLPEGLASAADLTRITEALAARGHAAQDLHKLLGGNLLRVFAEVQAGAPGSTVSSTNLGLQPTSLQPA